MVLDIPRPCGGLIRKMDGRETASRLCWFSDHRGKAAASCGPRSEVYDELPDGDGCADSVFSPPLKCMGTLRRVQLVRQHRIFTMHGGWVGMKQPGQP